MDITKYSLLDALKEIPKPFEGNVFSLTLGASSGVQYGEGLLDISPQIISAKATDDGHVTIVAGLPGPVKCGPENGPLIDLTLREHFFRESTNQPKAGPSQSFFSNTGLFADVAFSTRPCSAQIEKLTYELDGDAAAQLLEIPSTPNLSSPTFRSAPTVGIDPSSIVNFNTWIRDSMNELTNSSKNLFSTATDLFNAWNRLIKNARGINLNDYQKGGITTESEPVQMVKGAVRFGWGYSAMVDRPNLARGFHFGDIGLQFEAGIMAFMHQDEDHKLQALGSPMGEGALQLYLAPIMYKLDNDHSIKLKCNTSFGIEAGARSGLVDFSAGCGIAMEVLPFGHY